MPNKPKNYGLIPEPKIRAKDWRFGRISGASREILKEDGDYSEFLPDLEQQSGVYFDTMSCVSHRTCNAIEVIFRAKGWGSVNFSDRFIAKMSDTTGRGNYLSKVAETVRKHGLVEEEMWTWDPDQRNPIYDWDDFYAPIPQEVKMAGRRWLNDYQFSWEWVQTDKESLLEALKYGPVGVTVYAYNHKEDGIYPNPSNKYRNHDILLYSPDDLEYWETFDSYDHGNAGKKKMAIDYEFGHAILFTITKKKKIDPEKPMDLPNNALVQDAEGSGTFGLHVNGKMYVDDTGLIFASYFMRNFGDDEQLETLEDLLEFINNLKSKVVPIPDEEWDRFPKYNLKDEPIE